MRRRDFVSLLLASPMLEIGSSSAAAQNGVGDRPNARGGGTRSVVRATNGLIATSHPLAAAAGLRVLQSGGNAVDAALATVATLCVVEPMMVSPAGDLFAMIWDARRGELRALNASGRSPRALTIDALRARGFTRTPPLGIHAVTVPGAVDGWATLHARYATRPLAELLAPAIEYAERGFPVTEVIGSDWAREARQHAGNADFAATYLPGGRAPRVGEIFVNRRLGATLRAIGAGGRDEFYRGETARRILRFAESQGGLHTAADFSAQTSDWVEPLKISYRGYTVCEMPPNTQGLAVLEMLNILEGDDLRALGHNTPAYLHRLVEAKKLAFLDRARHITDPTFYEAPLAKLLSKDYASELRRQIDPRRTRAANAGPRGGEDTVYLTVVDRERNVVSLIQSIFSQFGSGLAAGETGLILHNRGAGFSFDPQHPNRVAGGKRPFHTLIPAMVLRDGRPWLSFGLMGGDMQAQGHVQALINLIDFGMDVQQAGEQPRFRDFENGLALESGIGAETRRALEGLGHQLVEAPGSFGGYQAIMIDPQTGALAGGSDPRKDGCAIGW
jgi:gamma-glutamyltranspeptidase/glutathione hydrolase